MFLICNNEQKMLFLVKRDSPFFIPPDEGFSIQVKLITMFPDSVKC